MEHLRTDAISFWATPNGLVCILLSKGKKKEAILTDDFFFGDPERTRTVDLQRDRLAC